MNWSTFILEIINFLVLVWILKHFLYKPVLGVIARRQSMIEETLAEAKALHVEAEGLQEQYEGRIAEWDQERQQAREALSLEFEAERTSKMTELQTSLKQEREKVRVAEDRRQIDIIRKIKETALIQGARFASLLLKQAAGAETEAGLIDLVIDELTDLPAQRITELCNCYGKTPKAIVVHSAFPLLDDQRQRLEKALAKIVKPDIPLRYKQDTELLAGVHITIGAWVLSANLRDELKGFTELTHAE